MANDLHLPHFTRHLVTYTLERPLFINEWKPPLDPGNNTTVSSSERKSRDAWWYTPGPRLGYSCLPGYQSHPFRDTVARWPELPPRILGYNVRNMKVEIRYSTTTYCSSCGKTWILSLAGEQKNATIICMMQSYLWYLFDWFD